MVDPIIVACVHSYLEPVLQKLNEIGQHPVRRPDAFDEKESLVKALRAIGVEEHLLSTAPTRQCLSHKKVSTASIKNGLVSAYRDAAAHGLNVKVEAHDGGATTFERTEDGETIAVLIFIDRTVYPVPPPAE